MNKFNEIFKICTINETNQGYCNILSNANMSIIHHHKEL